MCHASFDADFALGIIGHAIMRVGLVLMWLRAAARHPERRTTALRYAIGLIVVQAGWVTDLVVTGGYMPVWLFVLGVTLDFAVPFYAEKAGATPWDPHHIAERSGLFFIIVLGETVLSVALALQVALDKENPPPALALVIAGGVLITFCAWWLYFSREDADVLTGNDVGSCGASATTSSSPRRPHSAPALPHASSTTSTMRTSPTS